MGWGATDRRFLVGLVVLLAIVVGWSSPEAIETEPSRPPTLLVDVNTAPIEVLGALPGLGPALSGRIVEAREWAPFQNLDDLDRRVRGIGPAKAAAIRPFLRFDPPSAP